MVHSQLGSNGFWIDGALVGAESHMPRLTPFKNVLKALTKSLIDVLRVTRQNKGYRTRCSAKICIFNNSPNQTSGAPNVVL